MQDLGKFRLPADFRGRSAFVVQTWWLIQATLFAWSPQFAYSWRRWLLRLFGAKIGNDALIRPTVIVTYPWKLTVGDNSWIGDDVVLYTLGEIEIGSHSVVSQKSYICGASHDYSSLNFEIFSKKVSIGDGVWLATDVFVAPGVVISNNAVVGSRSSVYSNLPEGMICMGTPARPVKRREFNESITD